MDARTQAEVILREIADPAVLVHANRLIADGRARWEFDPEVDGVVGLVKTEPVATGRVPAYAVVYVTDRDFELDIDFDLSMVEPMNGLGGRS